MNLKKSLLRKTVLGFLIALVLIPQTNSSYVDEEKSLDNVFTAGVLDFSLDNETFSPDTINPGEVAEKNVVLNNNSSVDMEYHIGSYKTDGNADFCNSLNITAKLNGIEKYSGPLFSMTAANDLPSSDSVENWQFIISFTNTSTNLENKTCEFDIQFSGFQDDGTGFSDIETISNTIKSGDWTAPDTPVTLGFNSTYPDYTTRPVEIACGGTVTQNQLSHHWTEVADAVEYQTQWVSPGGDPNNENDWQGNDIWTTPYTDYRTFGGNPGIEGIWYFRVRAKDAAGNWSDYSSHCSVEYIKNGDEDDNSVSGIVINEVYYDVDVGNKGDEGKNEWVELYNNSDTPVSLQNWSLTDNAGTKNITSNTIIGAHDYLVVSHDNSTCANHWGCDTTKHINLGGSPGSGWLNNGGDYLILKDSGDTEVDFVAWEDGYSNSHPAWDINAGDGESIARKTAGDDTDLVNDWEVLSNPNPGTNPHSHIQVEVDNDKSNLFVSFENATGFDLVKYSIGYEHLYQDEYVSEKISGEKAKDINKESLDLEDKYFGTCSSKGEVCTSHKGIKNVIISLMYKKGQEILGTSEINYVWRSK